MSEPRPLDPRIAHGIDRILSVQRPIVLAHIRGLRRRHKDATPDQIIRILERRYVAAVTTGGAAVGASAVVPGIGTGISVALTSVETVGFLEASALFAQSVTEVHGIAVDDPDRARALVMTMILGASGSELVRQLAGQMSGTAPDHNRFWGQMITRGLPSFAVGPIADRVKHLFLRRFAITQGTNAIGRAVPFGVGAVIGGTGNHMLGRKVVMSSRDAFGPPPPTFPAALEPVLRLPRSATEPKTETETETETEKASRRGPFGLLPGRKREEKTAPAEGAKGTLD